MRFRGVGPGGAAVGGARSMVGSAGVRFLRRCSLWSSRVVLKRLRSILRSYIRRRSRTLALEKSFRAIRPRVKAGS